MIKKFFNYIRSKFKSDLNLDLFLIKPENNSELSEDVEFKIYQIIYSELNLGSKYSTILNDFNCYDGKLYLKLYQEFENQFRDSDICYNWILHTVIETVEHIEKYGMLDDGGVPSV